MTFKFGFQHLFLAFLIFQTCNSGRSKQNRSSKLFLDFRFNSDSNSDTEDIEDWESNNYNNDNDYDDDYQDQDRYKGHRHLVTREAVYDSHKYVNSCNKSVLMNKNKKIRIISAFRGKKQYFSNTTCEWNFLGSSECSSKISCRTIDLRTTATCDEDYLLIFDGVTGGLKLCGENSDLNKAKKSKEGSDLFVIFKSGESTNFKRLFKGIECVVSCDKTGDAEPLPEKMDMFKREPGCECGITVNKTLSNTRIIGGAAADDFEFPWLVGIVHANTRQIICGGSLINSDYVLTASHCFANNKNSPAETSTTSNLDIVIHMHNRGLGDTDEKSVRVKILHVICHPFYSHGKKFDYDVCILKLATPINILEHPPICLPPFTLDWSSLAGQNMTVAGWGKLQDLQFAQSSKILQKVQVPMLTQNDCVRDYKADKISTRMMCAGFPEGKKDSCQGDSGGPLMREMWILDKQIKREQIGVVSWGYGCAKPNFPGLYSNIGVLLPWIQKTAMSGTWCLDGDRTKSKT